MVTLPDIDNRRGDLNTDYQEKIVTFVTVYSIVSWHHITLWYTASPGCVWVASSEHTTLILENMHDLCLEDRTKSIPATLYLKRVLQKCFLICAGYFLFSEHIRFTTLA